MIIAFDGPAGSGKSTIAKIISEKLGITYLDTGAMYRAVTLYFLENGVDFNDEEQVKINLDKINLEFKNDDLYLNNKDVSVQIREKNINDNVSFVSAIKIVREKMVDLQRKMSGQQSVILDGRDIGTVVFPNADYKFYVTASPEKRAERRLAELKEKGSEFTFEEVLKDINDRDSKDMNRALNPLKKADDATEIITDDLDIEGTTQKLMGYIDR